MSTIIDCSCFLEIQFFCIFLRLGTAVQEEEDDSGSWSSADYWDTDYVQHWLRLDETRCQLQQQIEYDAAELEDWTMEELLTPNQPSLPSIQETNAPELEEDANECLWNSSSYLIDMTSDGNTDGRCLWPYNNSRCLISPGGDSWSSAGTNSEDSKSCNDCQNSSKRSSTAMSTDSGESPVIGTDFTRDFYRLVKFESTKSLASTSSKSQAGDNPAFNKRNFELPPVTNDREQALQSVLNFIAEQQQYCRSREFSDSRPNDKHIYLEDKDISPDLKSCRLSDNDIVSSNREGENAEPCDTPKNNRVNNESKDSLINNSSSNKIIKNNSETVLNDQNISDSQQPPVSVENIEVRLFENLTTVVNCHTDDVNRILDCEIQNGVDETRKNDHSLINGSQETDFKSQVLPNISCSSLSNSIDHKNNSMDCPKDDLVSYQTDVSDQLNTNIVIPRLLPQRSSTGHLHPVPEEDEEHCHSISSETSLACDVSNGAVTEECRSDVRSLSNVTSEGNCSQQTVIMNNDSKMLSFHEHASSKDVIDELNRMIRKGDENTDTDSSANPTANLDMACCCPTGWVHVERDIDFTDPKVKFTCCFIH